MGFFIENPEFLRQCGHAQYLLMLPVIVSRFSRYEPSISSLYRGPQCSTCGVRFDGSRAAAYSVHLDWHFRHNVRDQESYRKAASRKWYYPLEEWVQFEEISEMDEAGAFA